WLSFQGSEPGSAGIHIVGYPSDRGTGTQQFESQCGIDQLRPMDFLYHCATSGGMSGSAVWSRRDAGPPTVYGVHVYGLSDPAGNPIANSATRITPTVFQQLHYWIGR